MKKIRIVHFWIGVIVSVYLLIQSTTGIILYFHTVEEKQRFSMQGQLPTGQINGNQQSNLQNGQASSTQTEHSAFIPKWST
jgi:uncharacterized iron-regulated membrane protein